ncbi:MAG: SUMF1/EgtB/PvdO family nonheme iron enzyme [Oscillibacter sp.]|nr:SUMF1/EgtB/PvdO family nonheme iron enzyme [Oscillibacter sp.]
MNRWLLCFLLTGLLMSGSLMGNNVRISGEPDVQLNATSDSLSLTFTLSWDNSWRDNFNWDAVWLFVKYKKEGSTDAWSHLYLGGNQTGTSVLSMEPGNTGSQIVGAFVYPKNKGTFNIAGERVTLKAPLNGLSASDITDKKVYFAVSAIEMVLIPYGAYYLGDGVSNHTLKSYNIPMIPPEADIIGTSSEFSYSMSHITNATAYAFCATDRINNAAWDAVHVTHISVNENGASAEINNCWTVDFGTPKTILTFGVSISTYVDYITDYFPGNDWYLLGSSDCLTWDTLQRCESSWVTKDVNSYPVRRAIRVSSPGAYRYYRLFFPKLKGNGYMIANVAMSEQDLYPNGVNEYKYITSEEAITFGNSVVGGLYATDGTTWSGTLPATYPKGYKGFYIMKYELSQEQYCNFLNMLSYTQQKNRVGNNLDNLQRGDYVFGDTKRPSCRNGIAVFSNKGTTQPVVFGCNLNPEEPFFAADDGQTVACNYMTGADMLSYLDWSGLRPMSELEYEKACRTPSRVVPEEYAWNTISATPLGGQGGLSTSTIGTENEVPVNNNMNVNSGAPTFGPVRCGSFGTSTSNQEQSGASFYGVMEMSGNLGEMYYSVQSGAALNTNPTPIGNHEYHGDGSIDVSGNFNVPTYWNRSSETNAFSVRGGSFASPNSFLRISDRRVLMNYDNTTRDSTITFRGGRSLRPVLDPGKIGSDATCPGLITINSIQDAQGDDNLNYVWYVKRPENTFFELIEGEHGVALTNYDLVSVGRATNAAYTFRRKAVCLTDEVYVDFTLSVPNMLWQVAPLVTEIDACNVSDELKAISIVSGSTYEWKYNGTILSTTDAYSPNLSDFGGQSGNFNVVCVMSRANCKVEKEVTVRIPHVTRVSSSTEVTLANCGDVIFIDRRDNQEYCTVKVGAQCWMGQNLKYKTGRWMENDIIKYGLYYDWPTAMSNGSDETGRVKGICPDGWHLPSSIDWENAQNVGKWVKSLKQQLSGLYNNSWWESVESYGIWWSSDECKMYRVFNSSTNVEFRPCGGGYDTTDGMGIRCIKD